MDRFDPVISETVVAPYLVDFRDCILNAWNAWEQLQKVAPNLWLPLTPRSRASFIYDHIVDAATKKFSNRPHVRISSRHGMLVLEIRDTVVVRFKKLNRSGLSSNIQTKQQKRWFDFQLDLPGVSAELTKLIAGYKLDRTQTVIEEILITHTIGKEVLWQIPIPTEDPKVTRLVPREAPQEPRVPDIRSSRSKSKSRPVEKAVEE